MKQPERPIAAFDLDGTLHRGNLVSCLCEQLCRNGYFTGLYAQNMVNLFVQRDERQIPYRLYEEKLIQLLLVALRNKSQSELQQVADLVVAEAVKKTFAFTETLLHTLQPSHDCIAITGGLRETAEGVSLHWGFNACYSSILEVTNNLYTGGIVSTPVKDKSQALRLRRQSVPNASLECSVAIGDTLSDVALLEAVERPIVFNPDSGLAARADERSWPVVIERKDMIYVLQCGTCTHFTVSDAISAVRSVTTECRQLQ